MFKQRPDYENAEAPIARKEREVAAKCSRRAEHRPRRDQERSRREGTTGSRHIPQICSSTRGKSGNRRRGAYKSSAKAHHRDELQSDDANVEEHNCGKALSNLRLDLRINQEPGRKNKNVYGGGVIRQYPMESYSPPSYSSGENMDISRVSKSRPLLFSLSQDKKQSKDRGSKTSIRDVKTHKAKESSAVRPSGSKDSHSSEVDEHFFGEQNATRGALVDYDQQ
ncbi:hypothetical protein MRX96_027119 [Rhipicephalus microplus]